MKHDKRFKLAAVRRYLRGGIVYRDLANELGISKSALQRWVAWHHKHGAFIEGKRAHAYTPEFKLGVLHHMWENRLSHSQTSLHFEIPDHTSVGNWSRQYAIGGVNALMPSQKDDSASMTIPTTKPETPSTGADRNQKQLLKEIEQLRMENAYLKKLQALVASQGSKQSDKKPR